MTESQKLQIRASEQRSRLNELAAVENLTDDQRTELDTLTVEYQDTERRWRAAALAENAATETHTTETVDAETRERLALRSRCTLGGYLLARLQGREPAGELAEYAASCGVTDGIPLDLFESDRPVETHADAATPSPAAGSGAGLNIGRILPYIFDTSIAKRLGIAMPRVGTGTHSEMVVSTALTAAPKAKGAAAESTAAALTPVSANPRRISARLSIQAEDIAQIGTPRFEAALRSNLSEALSDQYDVQCLTGNGTAPNVNGLMKQLDTPTAPTDVATFDTFLSTAAAFAGSKYAETMRDVSIIVPADTYRKAVVTFRDGGNNHKGDVSAQRYLSDVLGGWSTATRLPVAPTSGNGANVSTGIVRRMGRGMAGAAVHPTWGSLSIDDVYTDSASATRHVTLHVLVGDKVMLVRPKGEVFDLVSYKVA